MTNSKPTRKIAAPLSAAETELLKAIGEAGDKYRLPDMKTYATCWGIINKGLVEFLDARRIYRLTDAGRSRLEAILEGEHASHI